MFDRLKRILAPGAPAPTPDEAHAEKPDAPALAPINEGLKKPAAAPADKVSAKKQGDEHLRSEGLPEAAACYRRALAIDPDYVDARVALGYVLSEQKQHGAAADELRRALAIDPRNADAHYMLGTIAKSGNDFAAAIDHFTRALDIQPDFEFAQRDLVAAAFGSGRVEVAKEALRRAVSAFPRSAEFQFHLGNVLRQEKDYDNAIACYEKAVALQPSSAESHKHLGDALREQGREHEAIESYRKAVWFAPDFVDAHIDLGVALFNQGLHDQAVGAYQRAVALKPDNVIAQTGLGAVLEKLGQTDEAIASYRRAVASEPDNARAHQFLGNALVAKGAAQEAISCYEEVVRLDPENPVKHLLAALSGRDSERAPADYVEKLFDAYANKFDSHLVEALNYSSPQKLFELMRPYRNPADSKWIVLDLGCGTGLSGVALAPHAERLVGVDLSSKMLDKARERNLYHRLEQADLLTMMQGEATASYDVAVATDVFIYIGKLDELVAELRRLLRPRGFFAFSVESLDAVADDPSSTSERRDYKLNTTARYAHASAYLARLATEHGFEVLSIASSQIRMEHGKPVEGYLSLWRRSPA
jgi:predicted TPR repeat methyltransferase